MSRSRILHFGIWHYHLKPGGVRTVIENTLKALTYLNDYHGVSVEIFSGDDRGVEFDKDRVEEGSRSGLSITVRTIRIPELSYSDRLYESRGQLKATAKGIRDTMIRSMSLNHCDQDNPYILNSHNLALGKNPAASWALKLLAEWALVHKKPLWVLNQVHDFAENNRPDRLRVLQNCTGTRDNRFAAGLIYPNLPGVLYAVLTRADRDNLIQVGLDPQRLFVLPNSINILPFESGLSQTELEVKGELLRRISRYAREQDFVFDPESPILLSPMKIMRRKNSLESVLILILLNALGEGYQLLLSLGAQSPHDLKYGNHLKQFIRKYRLPITVGFGDEFILSGKQRLVRNGRILQFSLFDLYAISTGVITTSIMEGFGLGFLEGWLLGLPVVGRRIPGVIEEFERAGLDFGHLYDRVEVRVEWLDGGLAGLIEIFRLKLNKQRRQQGLAPLIPAEIERRFRARKIFISAGRKCIDFTELDPPKQLALMAKIMKNRRLLDELLYLNQKIKSIPELVGGGSRKLIKRNREAIVKNYSTRAKANRLKQIIRQGNKLYREPMEARQAQKEISNRGLIEKYLSVEQINLLY
ncbi:hypothetical protein ISS37_03115 [candidate division KSB1 bacterium]|nr:hypothetical protein [candidate division KSB1 bacterium]